MLNNLVYAKNQQNSKTRSLHHLRRPQVSSRSPEGVGTHPHTVQILEAQAKLVGLASLRAPDGNSGRKEENEKRPQGETSLSKNWSISLFSRSTFILLVVHRKKCKKESHAGSAARPLSAYLCTYKGLTFVHNIFWSGDRLTFYGPTFLSIDKG